MSSDGGDDASPQRVFVTGANGFIGRAVADRYRAGNVVVAGVDATESDDDLIVAGDIGITGAWEDRLAGCDVVIHTAAVVSNTQSPSRCWEVNVDGTRRVLAAAARWGVKRFVHLSSVRAFSDRWFPDGVDEHWPVRTDGHAYVDTKVAAEQVVLQAHAAGDLVCTILRPGDVYGPGSRPWTVLPLEAIRARRFLLPDGGRGRFSPVYIDDLVNGILLAAGHASARGQVFILAPDETVTCKAFFDHYARMVDRRIPTAPAAVARMLFTASGLLDRLQGRPTEASSEAVDYFLRTGGYSNAKARSLLGWVPRVSLDEGMRRVEAWLAAQTPVASHAVNSEG